MAKTVTRFYGHYLSASALSVYLLATVGVRLVASKNS